MTAPSRSLVDGLRLAFGTLTVLPVPAPRGVDRRAAAVAMGTAVLPGACIGLLAALLGTGLVVLGVPAALGGVAVVGAGALATRFLHVDGLADTADGLTVPGDADRALAVMHSGDVGPAGATTLVLVLGGQVLAAGAVLAPVAGGTRAWWAGAGLVVLAWAASRAVLAVLCARGTVPARPGGLGAAVLGSVPRVAAAVPLLLCAAAGGAAVGWAGVVAVAVAAAAAALLARRAHRRLGGLNGDVLGAGVEVALLVALVVLATVPGS